MAVITYRTALRCKRCGWQFRLSDRSSLHRNQAGDRCASGVEHPNPRCWQSVVTVEPPELRRPLHRRLWLS